MFDLGLESSSSRTHIKNKTKNLGVLSLVVHALITGLGRQRQGDIYEFQDRKSYYIARPCSENKNKTK